MTGPAPIVINGKPGHVIYLDANWIPVEPEAAVLAKVLYDDGSVGFYKLNQ